MISFPSSKQIEQNVFEVGNFKFSFSIQKFQSQLFLDSMSVKRRFSDDPLAKRREFDFAVNEDI